MRTLKNKMRMGKYAIRGMRFQSAEAEAGQNKPETEKLKDVAEKSDDTLVKVKAVFPFDLFPDVVAMDRQKLTINHRSFFMIEKVVSVQHKDIKTIEAATGPFFGSLIITSEHFVNNTQSINFLWKNDAVKIQQMVQGAIIAAREKIDTSSVDKEELKELLCRLGTGESQPSGS